MGKWIVPRPAGGGGGGASGDWADAEFASRYPALAGWLGESVNEDGTARQTGTLLLFADGPTLKVCLRDRDSGCFCFLAARTVSQALQLAEDALFGGDADWRAGRAERPGKK